MNWFTALAPRECVSSSCPSYCGWRLPRLNSGELKLRTGNADIGAGRQHEAETFGVHEKECLILLNGPADRRSPLICVYERPRCATLIVEIAVGVKVTSVPPIESISVEAVAARLRHVIDVGASQGPVLAGVAVGYNRRFLHVVVAQ